MFSSIGFIGTGTMGAAVARAAVKGAQGAPVLLANRTRSKAEAVARELGAQTADNETVARECSLIFLGVKPQMMEQMLSGLVPILKARKDRFVLASMAAGLDARRIYEQVRDGLRRLMVTGVIREGEKLPSVRALASSLAINPNTIQRAYESLEAEGYVCSVPGKGSFAAPHTGVDQGRRDSLLGRFDTVTAELLYLGVTGEQLTSRVRAMEGGEAQ